MQVGNEIERAARCRDADRRGGAGGVRCELAAAQRVGSLAADDGVDRVPE
jgi:hypothetical protein